MTTSWQSRQNIGNNVIDIIYTGYWDDSKLWDDSKIWSDSGGVTQSTGRIIPITNSVGRTQILDYDFDANIDFDADIGFDGDRTIFTNRIIP